MVFKQSNMLPTSTTQWSSYIYSEAIDRLPELDSFIANYQTVLSPDEDGNAVSLIVLQGEKAFVPVVIKDWKPLPIDVIVYKKGKDLRSCFLSKRNLLKLLTNSSLGVNVSGRDRFVGDAPINYFSPAGGSARPTNPYFSGGIRSKTASSLSLYALQELRKLPFAEELTVVKIASEVPKVRIPNYAILHKDEEDRNYLIADNYPEGIEIDTEKVASIFATIENSEERLNKVASYSTVRTIVVGNPYNRPGNVLLRYESPERDSKAPKLLVPPMEGVFRYGGKPTYINPKVLFLDGFPTGYAMGVQLGGFSLSKDFSGYMANKLPDSAELSKEDLLATPSQLKREQIVCLSHEKNKTVSIPLKVLNISSTPVPDNRPGMQGRDTKSYWLTIKAKPLFGPDLTPVTITLADNEEVIQTSAFEYFYPMIYTKVRTLPNYVKYLDNDPYSANNMEEPQIQVIIKKRGGNLYSVQEENNFLGDFTPGKLVHHLISRYGASEDQAIHLLERGFRDVIIMFTVRELMPNLPTHADLNEDDISDIEKEAKDFVDDSIKIASGLKAYQEFPSDKVDDFYKLTSLLGHYFNEVKIAAQETSGNTSASQNAEQRADTASQQLGGEAYNQQQVMSYLMSSKTKGKNTNEVIDLLTYYASGKVSAADSVAVENELDSALDDAENLLSRILLLTQFAQMPGHEYSDIRVLLAKIDNYRSDLSSSLIMIQGIK